MYLQIDKFVYYVTPEIYVQWDYDYIESHACDFFPVDWLAGLRQVLHVFRDHFFRFLRMRLMMMVYMRAVNMHPTRTPK